MTGSAEIGPEADRETSPRTIPGASPEWQQAQDDLLAFRQGDLSAFESLFRRHQRAVFGWILRIVRNPATAEELTVETFWRIYRAHARFDPARGFEGWARRIATHAALDYLRSQRPETDLPGELAAPAIGDPAVSAEIRREVVCALARLPAKLRIA